MIGVDIVIVLILIIAAIRGFSKGFIMQIASLTALAGGILISYFFWEKSYLFLQKWIELNHYILKIIAVVGTTLIVVLVILLLGKLLSKLIKITPFGIIDNLLGMLFGTAQIILLLSFIIFTLLYINPQITFLQDNYLESSYLLPHIKTFAPALVSWFS